MDLTGLGALSGIGQAVSDRKTIANNFDTFLQLLTTQLQNQNPLDPLDTNEFTNQLVQFSGVEQSIKTNENLEAILRLSVANTATAAVSYIGKTISASGTSAELSNGRATWTYTADRAAGNVTVTVRDSSDTIVFSQQGAIGAGTGTFVWDGVKDDGSRAPDGDYTISMAAFDDAGQVVPVKTSVGGIVDSIDLAGEEPVLIIGSQRINLSTVQFISQ